jgi:Ca-activated chloride channel family protein
VNRYAATAGLIVLLLAGPAAGLDPFSTTLQSVEEGNQLYGEQHFEQALDKYESAEQIVQREPRIHFNRGDALYKLGRPKEAREAYLRATGTEDRVLKKKNYYNIGNTFLAEGAFQDAISYYRRALELDESYDDARYNLELAIRALKQQQQQQKDKSGDQGDKDQKQQDGEKDQKQDEDEKQQQEQDDEEKQQDQQKDQQQQEDQQQQKDQQEEEKKQQEDPQQDQQEKDGQQEQDQQKDQQQQDGEQQPREQEDPQKAEQKPKDTPGKEPKEVPGRLSKAQVRDLLDSMRENEKPFQMERFLLPEYKRKKVDKDW